jgi:hypothetical protein
VPDDARFESIFADLKALLVPYAAQLVVAADTATGYSLDTPYVAAHRKAIFFGGVRIGKRYVSYHLMPVYASAPLRDSISPALRKRMQGKSCFNFTTLDEDTKRELTELTARGFDGYRALGWV